MNDFEHKRKLYAKYVGSFGEEEIAKRLGLKPWELDYFKKTVYGRLPTDAGTAGPDKE